MERIQEVVERQGGSRKVEGKAVDVEGVSDNAASTRIYEFILIN